MFLFLLSILEDALSKTVHFEGEHDIHMDQCNYMVA